MGVSYEVVYKTWNAIYFAVRAHVILGALDLQNVCGGGERDGGVTVRLPEPL